MCCANTPIKQLIRGHFGSVVLGNGEEFSGYDYIAERPQVTHDGKLKDERVEVGTIPDSSLAHFQNFVDAVAAEDPNTRELLARIGSRGDDGR